MASVAGDPLVDIPLGSNRFADSLDDPVTLGKPVEVILDVSGLGLSLVDTGSSILFNGNPIINYSGIESVVGAVAAVPEPLSAALISIGLAGIGVASRRRMVSKRAWTRISGSSNPFVNSGT